MAKICPSFRSIGTMGNELCEFKKKRKKNMDKMYFCCTIVKDSIVVKNNLKLRAPNFLMYGENIYINHIIYI